MFKLVPQKGGKEIYTFFVGQKYTVGRKTGDLIFSTDSSISRNHAEIEVEFPLANVNDTSLTPTLKVMDLGSKFGSFINVGGREGVELARLNMREPESLVDGDTVRFGMQWNEFKVKYTPLVAMGSTLSDNEKKEVKEIVWKLGGHFLNDWSPDVGFVVMSVVKLTTKAVCGLLAGSYIVTPQYFKDLLNALENDEPEPEPRNYEPLIGESNISPGVSLQPSPARKKLFRGKTFVFFNNSQARNLATTVTSGGGEWKLLKNATEELAESSATMFFEPPRGSFVDTQNQKLIDMYKKTGKRLVTECDLSLAALYSSIAKYCNAYHNFSQQLIAPSMTSQTQSSQARAILVPETQEADPPSVREGSRMVVEESLNMSRTSTRSSSRHASEPEFPRPVSRGSATNAAYTKEETDAPSAKRRLESQQSASLISGPSPKRQKPTAAKNISSQSRTTRSKGKTLSAIFGMSDDEDDDDLDVIPPTREDSQSQSQLRPRNESNVPAADFDFVGIRAKHLKSPTKSPNKTKPSTSKSSAKNNTAVDDSSATACSGTAYVDFVPGTPEMSDDDDTTFAGLVEAKEARSETSQKNTKVTFVDLEDEDPVDTSVLPTVKLSTLSTCQLPTLAIDKGSPAKKRKDQTSAKNKKVDVKWEQDSPVDDSKKKKKGDLTSWLVSSSKRKVGIEDNHNVFNDSVKKRRVNIDDDDDEDIKPEVKIETEETTDQISSIISPAPFEVVSLIKNLPTVCEPTTKNQTNGNVPNFKTFRKILPLQANNFPQKTASKSITKPQTSISKMKLVPVNTSYIDKANDTLTQQENSEVVPSQTATNVVNGVASVPPSIANGSSTRQASMASDDKERPTTSRAGRRTRNNTPVSMVVDLDPDDFGPSSVKFQPKLSPPEDPSEGMFDF